MYIMDYKVLYYLYLLFVICFYNVNLCIFDFYLILKWNVFFVNGFGLVSFNVCNNILIVDWEGLFSDKLVIDV